MADAAVARENRAVRIGPVVALQNLRKTERASGKHRACGERENP
jgi:hypothetical protein